jgi:hypothetical protein
VGLVTLWFWLIAFTFTLYFFLEGFDFGVDILRPTLARTEAEERAPPPRRGRARSPARSARSGTATRCG